MPEQTAGPLQPEPDVALANDVFRRRVNSLSSCRVETPTLIKPALRDSLGMDFSVGPCTARQIVFGLSIVRLDEWSAR